MSKRRFPVDGYEVIATPTKKAQPMLMIDDPEPPEEPEPKEEMELCNDLREANDAAKKFEDMGYTVVIIEHLNVMVYRTGKPLNTII